jgi:hypothetical protein
MKHLIKFKIFESVQSYDFTYEGQEGTSWVYLLKDEFENQFKVEISRRPENEVELIYLVKSGDNWTYKEVKTNIWKLTETIIGKILNDFLNRNDWVESVKIVGLGKNTEKDAITQRTKLYWRYLSNNPIQGWELDKYGNEIYLYKI